ncbi:kinase-like domain-containing protein [Entophlyctis helioformis]|nr:kinase-like domain-containing protein [Entophlyctis helioformis]
MTRHSAQPIKETLNAKVTEEESGQRRLNQYVIERVLGTGSFGIVHLGLDTELDRHVAIKEFSKTKLRKQQALKNGGLYGAFRGRGRGRGRGGGDVGGHAALEAAKAADPLDLVRGEIAILKKLSHKNVVKLFEVLDDPDQDSLFMVFEVCERGALTDVSLDRTAPPLDVELSRKYLRETLLGIEYLHEHDIVHRDIKPDNLLISKDGVLKIVDFGVSEIFTKESGTVNKSAGSPAFYSPEMCTARHGNIQAKGVDIWAIGVTLYCMLYGRIPFSGRTILDLYENIRTAEPTYPADIDPLLLDLFQKLLDKNPDTRIEMEQLRQHPWVTDNGKQPLISKEVNCEALVLEVTQSDLDAAVKPVQSLFTVLKAVSKLKGKRSTMFT